MRATILLFTTSLSLFSQAQTIELGKGINLTAEVVAFDPTQHSIKRCPILNWEPQPICLIDGKPYFGSDLDSKTPRDHFRSLAIDIAGIRTDLDVSGMFNVSSDGLIHPGQFEIAPVEGGHELNGFFSDGAGVYTVTWRIMAGGAIRTELKEAEH